MTDTTPGPQQEESRGRLGALSPGMFDAARSAVEKGLIDPETFQISRDHVAAGQSRLESLANPVGLEAIVLATGRPPMLIRDDKVVFDDLARNAVAMQPELAGLTQASIIAIEPWIPSIGRIEFINNAMQWGGTGFVVDEIGDKRRVITNRHVAKLIAQRRADGSGVFMRSPIGALYGAKIDMRKEAGSDTGSAFECPVERVVYLADDTEADCALLEITTTASCKPGKIDLADQRAENGELVATIGYPAYDDRNDAAVMRRYFGDLFGVKRFAPGLVMSSGKGTVLSHDCTTLGGNSGSALLSLKQKAIVGLHFAGEYGIGNSAVSVETLKQLLTGRLFAVTAGTQPGEAVESEAADRTHDPDYFTGREGYDPAFLADQPVPLPTMDATLEADLATPSDATDDRPHELRYTHFSVLYSRGRRTPRVTAVNIDGEQTRKIKRIPPDKWAFDLRIAQALQLGQGYYAGDFDRGHLVRREDPNWGSDAQAGNDDSFHYTNCALQHSDLNRGKTLWQGLENYILDSARTDGFRASVFTGPILRDDDPELGKDGVLVPREYWKVVVMNKTGGGLHATAYLLSQGDLIRQLLEQRAAATRSNNEAAVEGFQLGAYRTFQVAVRHIETATGLNFGALAAADALPAATRTTEAIDSGPLYLPLDSTHDLIL